MREEEPQCTRHERAVLLWRAHSCARFHGRPLSGLAPNCEIADLTIGIFLSSRVFDIRVANTGHNGETSTRAEAL